MANYLICTLYKEIIGVTPVYSHNIGSEKSGDILGALNATGPEKNTSHYRTIEDVTNVSQTH